MQLMEKPMHQLSELLSSGAVTAEELVDAAFARIGAVDDQVGAYLTLDEAAARQGARTADARRRQGGAHALCGIPIAIKDNISTRGLRTTCGSFLLEDYVPPFDATAVARLRAVGAVILGKTNLDEFGLGSSTETSMYRFTANPWDLNKSPGGSSGGSAAAVAAGMAGGALGSDTGGSIRQPAAFCGIVGLKPTYGLVSRYGLVPVAPSLDHIGPMTRDVRDAALLLGAIAGQDNKDATTQGGVGADYMAALSGEIKGVVVGVPGEIVAAVEDQEVQAAFVQAVKVLESAGAQVEEVRLPHGKYAAACFHLLAAGEVSSSLGSFDGVRLGRRVFEAADTPAMFTQTRGQLGSEAKRRILAGTAILQADHRHTHFTQAQKVRTLIAADVEQALTRCQIMLLPTTPTPAFPRGRATADPVAMYEADVFTCIANLAGIPALSVPCGFTAGGLPLGIQILGRPFAEATVLNAGYAYEQAASVGLRQPQLEVRKNG